LLDGVDVERKMERLHCALGRPNKWEMIVDMASLPNASLTEEQYLHSERQAETKSEFHDGKVFATAGVSFNHALISNNIGALLRSQVQPGCRALNSEMRIKIASAGLYTYADCSVICGAPQYFGDQRDVVLNPLLLVEVLSPSTEAYDRGKKFELYRTIPTLREYLLIHQDRHHVEHYSKQDDSSWLLREYSGLEACLEIGWLSVRIPLGEIYASVLDIEL
jgi:Uma2 family endonuclease